MRKTITDKRLVMLDYGEKKDLYEEKLEAKYAMVVESSDK